MPMKVLVDTDIGTDADDAVCLAYLLLHPDCEIVGVTTVGRDPELRAGIVSSLCHHFEQPDIPVASGAGAPILANRYWWHHHVNQSGVAERWPGASEHAPYGALELMRRVIREHEGEVTLLTLGPVTNAAHLAITDPRTMGMLKGVMTMGGRFGYDPEQPRTECNVMLDPAAAGALFLRNAPGQTVVSTDTTGPLSLSRDEMEARFAAPALAPVLECCRCWVDRCAAGRLGLHDPFTAAVLMQSGLCTFTRGRVGTKLYDYDLDRGFKLDGDQLTGATYFDPDEQGPHRLAQDGQRDAFMGHLFAVLARA